MGCLFWDFWGLGFGDVDSEGIEKLRWSGCDELDVYINASDVCF